MNDLAQPIENGSSLQIHPAEPVVTLINVFTPKPDQTEAFCAAQIGEYQRLSGKIDGSLGSNLHVSLDGKFAANYAQFTSEEAYRAWYESDLFKEHLEVIHPYIAKVEPMLYRVAFTQVVHWSGEGDAAHVDQVSENEGGALLKANAPVITLINRFTPKPGQTDAFCTAQIGEYRRLHNQVRGVVSTNLHRSLDGSMAANYAQFESEEVYRAWIDGPLFKPHLAIIQPFVERADPILFKLIYTLHAPGSRITND